MVRRTLRALWECTCGMGRVRAAEGSRVVGGGVECEQRLGGGDVTYAAEGGFGGGGGFGIGFARFATGFAGFTSLASFARFAGFGI